MTFQELKPSNKRSVGWKVYIWIYFLLALITVIMSFSYFKSELLIMFRVLISFVLIVGVFGFAYSKRFLSRRFWQVFLFVAILDEFIDVADLIYMNQLDQLAQLIKYAIVLPCFLAVFQYAYRLDNIWRDESRNSGGAVR